MRITALDPEYLVYGYPLHHGRHAEEIAQVNSASEPSPTLQRFNFSFQQVRQQEENILQFGFLLLT